MAGPYHSALHPAIFAERVARVEHPNGSIAMVHDVMDGLPEEMNDCDVLYADLPWRDGFGRFNRRAGVRDDRTYPALMRAVSEALNASSAAAVMVTGKHAKRLLPPADAEVPVTLNGGPSVAYVYRMEALPMPGPNREYLPARDLLAFLADRYDRVGDFCCGYGRSGRTFIGAGKTAVLSDLNPMCIGMIASEWGYS
jgi:hypothetical protein